MSPRHDVSCPVPSIKMDNIWKVSDSSACKRKTPHVPSCQQKYLVSTANFYSDHTDFLLSKSCHLQPMPNLDSPFFAFDPSIYFTFRRYPSAAHLLPLKILWQKNAGPCFQVRAVRKYTSFGPRLGPFFFNHPNIENVELPGSVHPYLPMFIPFFLGRKTLNDSDDAMDTMKTQKNKVNHHKNDIFPKKNAMTKKKPWWDWRKSWYFSKKSKITTSHRKTPGRLALLGLLGRLLGLRWREAQSRWSRKSSSKTLDSPMWGGSPWRREIWEEFLGCIWMYMDVYGCMYTFTQHILLDKQKECCTV